MAKKKAAAQRYRCENEYGDPCTLAREGTLLDAEEVGQAVGGEGPPCPGKTESGKTCGQPLVALPLRYRFPWWWWIAISVGAIIIGLVAWWLLSSTGPQPKLVLLDDPVKFRLDEQGGATGSLRIENQGKEELEITTITASPDSFQPNRREASIDPGKTRTIVIRFVPGARERSGELVLRSNDPDASEQRIVLDASDIPVREPEPPPIVPKSQSKSPSEIWLELCKKSKHLGDCE